MRKKSDGFTIVELIIVIVVIGILAFITLQVFGSAKRRAEVAKTDASVRYIMKIVQAYREQNGHLPRATAASGATCMSEESCYILGESVSIDSELETEFKTLMGNYYSNVHGSAVSFTSSGRGGDVTDTYTGIFYSYNDSYFPAVPSEYLRQSEIKYVVPDENYVCPGAPQDPDFLSSGRPELDTLINGEYLGPMSYEYPLGSNAKACIVQFYEAL
jgi:type IV pilus assembly protein PilA